jgi:two-component system sensor histidine kinase KdpD
VASAEAGIDERERARGRLVTYLGTAPGVGKTYEMLNDGWRRSEAGERVVVGWLQAHARETTDAQLRTLPVVPPRLVEYRGRMFDELDVDAVIADNPEIALVDELAHTSPDGSRRRIDDVAALLDQGITVLTTVNIGHLVSMRDYVARVTGAGIVESVADEFVRAGDVVLVDPPPEVLRRRIAAGLVYSSDRVGIALGDYFRVSNLAALHDLAQAWCSQTVEEVAPRLLARRGVGPVAEHPVVVAGVSGSRWGEAVLLQAAAAAAEDDAELLVVHVDVTDGVTRADPDTLERYRTMTNDLGGQFLHVAGADAAPALADVARERHATRVFVARHRSRLHELLRGSVAARLRRRLHDSVVEEVTGVDKGVHEPSH